MQHKKENLLIRITKYIVRLQAHIRLNKRTFIIYSILRGLVILTLIRCLMTGNYESAMYCVLSLILFLLPSFFTANFKITIPPVFEIIIYCFIFAAEILGEINHYYVLIPGWDTMLHTINGFLCAAVGYSLVDLLNRNSKNMDLSPFYLTIQAFCFSMTVGVLWEFFEFSMDSFFLMDTQKDFIVNSFGSVTLDPNMQGATIRVTGITETLIKTASGEIYTIPGGYLDIGIQDTMKDLIVNFVGAVVFCIFGYIYVKNRQKNIASKLMITNSTEEEIQKLRETDDALAAKEQEIREKLLKKKADKLQ